MKEEEKKEFKERIEENRNAYKKLPRKTRGDKYLKNGVYNTKFSSYLKHERLDLGLTQKDMANRFGLKYDTYKELENGKRPLINNRLRKLLTASECKIISKNGDIIFE